MKVAVKSCDVERGWDWTLKWAVLDPTKPWPNKDLWGANYFTFNIHWKCLCLYRFHPISVKIYHIYCKQKKDNFLKLWLFCKIYLLKPNRILHVTHGFMHLKHQAPQSCCTLAPITRVPSNSMISRSGCTAARALFSWALKSNKTPMCITDTRRKNKEDI